MEVLHQKADLSHNMQFCRKTDGLAIFLEEELKRHFLFVKVEHPGGSLGGQVVGSNVQTHMGMFFIQSLQDSHLMFKLYFPHFFEGSFDSLIAIGNKINSGCFLML